MDTVENHQTNDIYVYIKGSHTDITKTSPTRVFDDFQKILHRRPTIKLSGISLRITCLNSREKEILLDTQFIAGHQISCTEPYEKTRNLSSRPAAGIIFDVDVDISIDEIERELGVRAKRNIKRIKGQIINTRQVILFFEGEIPEFVFFGWRRFRVALYIPDLIRCYRCQGYGHKANRCNYRQKCPICSKNHEYEHCPAKNDNREYQRAVCPNCNGNHPASYKGCSKYTEAKDIVKIQTKEKISYADAARTLREKEQRHNAQAEHTNLVITSKNQPLEENNHASSSNSNIRDEVNVPHAPPRDKIPNPHHAEIENTHQQCVKTEILAEFFQAFTNVLLTEMNFNPDSKEIIAKLCQLVDGFLKSINKLNSN